MNLHIATKLYLLTTNSTAGTGPMPIILGSTPASATATILANGESPFCIAVSADIRTTAAAPSLTPEALPAVTVPLAWQCIIIIW